MSLLGGCAGGPPVRLDQWRERITNEARSEVVSDIEKLAKNGFYAPALADMVGDWYIAPDTARVIVVKFNLRACTSDDIVNLPQRLADLPPIRAEPNLGDHIYSATAILSMTDGSKKNNNQKASLTPSDNTTVIETSHEYSGIGFTVGGESFASLESFAQAIRFPESDSRRPLEGNNRAQECTLESLKMSFDREIFDRVIQLTKAPGQARADFLSHVGTLSGELALVKALGRYYDLVRAFARQDAEPHARMLNECSTIYDQIFEREAVLTPRALRVSTA